MMRHRALSLAALVALPLSLTACELAPKTSQQTGFRGTGINQIYVNDDVIQSEVPPPPFELPEDTGGPRASEVYENVQVLGNLSADEFNYLMAAITEWVSPEEGCNYCHNPANMASDEIYTKAVARQMLLMTQDVNQNWQDHVAQTGVTCWTCHRGNNIPEEVWTLPVEPSGTSIARNRRGQNNPTPDSSYSSLPEASVARYLLGEVQPGDPQIRVNSTTMHPTDANTTSTMEAENTYALMMHMSASLGVNCTYCHNSQNFAAWEISGAPRVTAWYGINMVRNINETHVTPLTDLFPANRLGPAGDPYKVNCTTCHQGQNKPLGGVRMVADYPGLQRLLGPVSAPSEGDAATAASPETTDTN